MYVKLFTDAVRIHYVYLHLLFLRYVHKYIQGSRNWFLIISSLIYDLLLITGMVYMVARCLTVCPSVRNIPVSHQNR